MSTFKHNNRTCIVCGTKYRHCSSCSEFKDEPTWKAMFHDENCKNIFDIAYDLENGYCDKLEAKKRFNECDLSNKVNFNKSIIGSINKANESDKPDVEKLHQNKKFRKEQK